MERPVKRMSRQERLDFQAGRLKRLETICRHRKLDDAESRELERLLRLETVRDRNRRSYNRKPRPQPSAEDQLAKAMKRRGSLYERRRQANRQIEALNQQIRTLRAEQSTL